MLLKHRILANAPSISRENLLDLLKSPCSEHLHPHSAGLALWGWPRRYPRPLGCCRGLPLVHGAVTRPPLAIGVWLCSYPQSMGQLPPGFGGGFRANPFVWAVTHRWPKSTPTLTPPTGSLVATAVVVAGWVGEVVMGNGDGDGVSAEQVGVLGSFSVV